MATPLEVLQAAVGSQLLDRDGHESTLALLPPLSGAEIAELETSLGPLPSEVRELLAVTRGLDGILETLDLYALKDALGLEDLLGLVHPIAHDGCGNFWVADVRPDSGTWGGILYVCHDPPVVVFQAANLAGFLADVLLLGSPPWESPVHDVTERHAMRIWRESPGVLTYDECIASGEETLAAFASELGGTFDIFDLRGARTGEGFSWDRCGPRTVARRHHAERLFAMQRPPRRKPFLSRLFGAKDA